MSEATWGEAASPEIDWRMSAALEKVPRGDEQFAEVTSLEGSVRAWLALDAEHCGSAVLTPKRSFIVGGAALEEFTGEGIAALAERLPGSVTHVDVDLFIGGIDFVVLGLGGPQVHFADRQRRRLRRRDPLLARLHAGITGDLLLLGNVTAQLARCLHEIGYVPLELIGLHRIPSAIIMCRTVRPQRNIAIHPIRTNLFLAEKSRTEAIPLLADPVLSTTSAFPAMTD